MTTHRGTDYTIILNNGGGITLQLGGWAHWYPDARQAAADLRAYIADGDSSGWDGHEEEAMDCHPTADEIRNGGYRVYHDIADMRAADGWGNERALVAALAQADEMVTR
jgi:hypothetical protein